MEFPALQICFALLGFLDHGAERRIREDDIEAVGCQFAVGVPQVGELVQGVTVIRSGNRSRVREELTHLLSYGEISPPNSPILRHWKLAWVLLLEMPYSSCWLTNPVVIASSQILHSLPRSARISLRSNR